MKLEKYREKRFRKKAIIIFTIICILLIAGVFFYTSFASFENKATYNIIEGTIQPLPDLSFNFYRNGVISSTMPSKAEGYTFSSFSCTPSDATVEFNEEEWSVKVLNMTGATKCNLYFTTTQASFAETLLQNGETDELKFDNTIDNNLRYIGANPNNYVTFNNELWRIIGVMNNIDDGEGNKESKLKIIKAEPYALNVAWDEEDENNWATSNLQEELNTTYYNSIAVPYQEMISTSLWNIGQTDVYENLTTLEFYESERKANNNTERPDTWKGKIAISYISDAGFATNGKELSRESCLENSLTNWNEYSDCFENAWLFFENTYWALTTYSGNTYYAFRISNSGRAYIRHANNAENAVYPTVYLNADVKISSGNGSLDEPFELTN